MHGEFCELCCRSTRESVCKPWTYSCPAQDDTWIFRVVDRILGPLALRENSMRVQCRVHCFWNSNTQTIKRRCSSQDLVARSQVLHIWQVRNHARAQLAHPRNQTTVYAEHLP